MFCAVCAGQQLAKVNMPTALGMLVSNFKFELTPEARPHQGVSLTRMRVHHSIQVKQDMGLPPLVKIFCQVFFMVRVSSYMPGVHADKALPYARRKGHDIGLECWFAQHRPCSTHTLCCAAVRAHRGQETLKRSW